LNDNEANPCPAALEGIRGCCVTRLIIDDALTLSLQGAGRSASLRIDGRGRVSRHGSTFDFEPDQDPTTLREVLGLLYGVVKAVFVENDGTLELYFEDGAKLEALPDDYQVSWQVRCGNLGVACIAEGKVVWE